MFTQTPQQCVVAIYSSLALAETGLRELDRAGFRPDDVSLIRSTPREDGQAAKAVQHGDMAPKAAAMGAGAGGLLGLLVGASLLTIPGVGPIFVAGAMAMGLTGAVVGSVLGCMAGWGVHEDHIKNYEKRLQQGEVLLIVHGNPRKVADAQRVLQDTEVVELNVHAKTGDDSPEVDDSPEALHTPRADKARL